MDYSNINIVSTAILLIVLIYIIKGALNKFSPEIMFYSVSSYINGLLFFISVGISIYITRKIFIDNSDGGIYGLIYDVIPKSITIFLKDAGILMYVMVTPLVMMIIFPLLEFIKSMLDGFLRKTLFYLCKYINRASNTIRIIIGIILETPKAFLVTVIVVLAISLLNTYYPVATIIRASQESRIYNYIYSYTVSPIMESSLGEKIPVFLWRSVEEISKGVGDSKVLNKSGTLKTFGLIRFQYETNSNEEIDNMAKKIVGKETDERKKAYLLYKWVSNNISYDWDKYNDIINGIPEKNKFGAIPAYTTRKGVCEDYSDLYVAMARAVGLKVRIIVGQGYSHSTDSWGGHAWNEVYISKEKRWIPIDTTWGKWGNYFDTKDFNKDHVFEAVAGEW